MKTILITGASRGIGRATALLCGTRGWSVAINFVHDELAAEASGRAVVAAGGRAATAKGDVAVESDVIGMFDTAEASLVRSMESLSMPGSWPQRLASLICRPIV